MHIHTCTGFVPNVHNKVHPITQFYISKKRKLFDTEEIYIKYRCFVTKLYVIYMNNVTM